MTAYLPKTVCFKVSIQRDLAHKYVYHYTPLDGIDDMSERSTLVFLQPKRSKKICLEVSSKLNDFTVHYRNIRNLLIWPAFSHWGDINKATLHDVIQWHIKRRIRKNPTLFKFGIVRALYTKVLPTICRLRYCMLYRVLAPLKPSHVLINNGNRSPELLVPFITERLGAQPFFFEAGMIPGTNQCDPRGVNELNSVPRDQQFYQTYADQQGINVQPDTDGTTGGDYFFVPFQVDYDTQIIRHGNWVGSMAELLEHTIQLANDCPNDTFIIKEHPLARIKLEQANKSPLPSNLSFSSGDTKVLIANARAVITVNSTVGMESVVLRKKVIVLGEACYGVPTMVQMANTYEQLVTHVQTIDQFEQDVRVRKAYIHYLENGYLIPKPMVENCDSLRRQLASR